MDAKAVISALSETFGPDYVLKKRRSKLIVASGTEVEVGTWTDWPRSEPLADEAVFDPNDEVPMLRSFGDDVDVTAASSPSLAIAVFEGDDQRGEFLQSALIVFDADPKRLRIMATRVADPWLELDLEEPDVEAEDFEDELQRIVEAIGGQWPEDWRTHSIER